jgi:UDP:flavonoid glycosyltransferase YjiC (YdhE family)
MARFLFTMMPANDLGLPTRMVPIARALADRGHEVAVFNPAPAPAKLIAEAGLTSLPMPARPFPAPVFDLTQVSQAWDVEHFFGAVYTQEEYVRDTVAVYVDLMLDYAPDMVVDSFEPLACLAARILKLPLATVLQGNIHPASRGFVWWESKRPAGLPSAAAFMNTVASEYGLPPIDRCVDLMAGDLALIVGTPETDPLAANANVTYIGPMVFQRGDAALPAWVEDLSREQSLVWVYSGNPRYAPVATPIDSIVVIRAAMEALKNAPVQVALTTGYQDLPEEFGVMPPNFHHAAYVPGLLMAKRCDLMVHHGGHGSVMTGLMAGTPAVIIPTITERESNARRLAALGAGEVVIPIAGADGEKRIDAVEFGKKVRRVLGEPSYRQSARRIAESMRQFGGANAAAERIEEFAVARGVWRSQRVNPRNPD